MPSFVIGSYFAGDNVSNIIKSCVESQRHDNSKCRRMTARNDLPTVVNNNCTTACLTRSMDVVTGLTLQIKDDLNESSVREHIEYAIDKIVLQIGDIDYVTMSGHVAAMLLTDAPAISVVSLPLFQKFFAGGGLPIVALSRQQVQIHVHLNPNASVTRIVMDGYDLLNADRMDYANHHHKRLFEQYPTWQLRNCWNPTTHTVIRIQPESPSTLSRLTCLLITVSYTDSVLTFHPFVSCTLCIAGNNMVTYTAQEMRTITWARAGIAHIPPATTYSCTYCYAIADTPLNGVGFEGDIKFQYSLNFEAAKATPSDYTVDIVACTTKLMQIKKGSSFISWNNF